VADPSQHALERGWPREAGCPVDENNAAGRKGGRPRQSARESRQYQHGLAERTATARKKEVSAGPANGSRSTSMPVALRWGIHCSMRNLWLGALPGW